MYLPCLVGASNQFLLWCARPSKIGPYWQVILETNTELAFNLIRLNAPPGTIAGPVEDAAIDDAEEELSVKFPSEYRSFLKSFGALRWPEYVCGLGNRLYPAQRVVAITKEERYEMEPNLPGHLIPVSPDGWGNHYCLDVSQASDDRCPVVLWDHN